MSSVHSSLQQSTQQPPPPPSVKQELVSSSPSKSIPQEEDPSQFPSAVEDDHSSEQEPETQIIETEATTVDDVGPVDVPSPHHDQVSPITASPVIPTGPKVTQQQQQQQVLHQQIPPKFQDVRVDNWGNYCLQRLQVMYDRGDFCDLTLQFHSQQLIKVHRVVLNLCTEYFANLERLFGLTDGHLVLPKDVEYQAMLTIIKFFYTGKLEIRGNIFNEVYKTVKLMNVSILIKLLEAHAKKPAAGIGTTGGSSGGGGGPRPSSSSSTSSSFAAQGKGSPNSGGGASSIKPLVSQRVVGMSGSAAVSVQGGTKTLQVTTPGLRLPPGVRTKTVLARVQPQNMRNMVTSSGSHKVGSNASILSKKLPIWKERKFSPASQGGSSESGHMDKWPPKEEPARPTRFEWGDPEDDFLGACSANSSAPVVSHTLMDKHKVTSSSCRKVEDIFDAVKNQSLGKRQNSATNANSPHLLNNSNQPPAKLTRLEVPILSHQQHQSGVILPTHDSSSDQVNLTDDTVEEEVCTSETPMETSTTGGNAGGLPKPILKPALKGSSSGEVSVGGNTHDESLVDLKPALTHHKTVRFANDLEKENASVVTSSSNTIIIHAPSTTSTASPSSSNNASTSFPGDEMQPSHSKIISEVLKKYPDLVKDRSNIRLKIVTRGGPPPGGDTSSSTMSSPAKGAEKSKVSYIVLKSTSSPDSLGSAVLRKPAGGGTNAAAKAFWSSDSPADGSSSTPGAVKKPSGAENTTGPWLCGPCGGGDHSPIQFDTYYSYRRHLVDVHGERIDARICEYCGQRASKRNLLLYHMYTKHSIPPPKNTTFPACDRCDYVALSESLLNKHKQGHDGAKEYSCLICNASFKSPAALQGHMAANLHRNKDTKVYECPYCRKPFVRNINLKAHIRSVHREIARIEEMDDPRLPLDESLANRPPPPPGSAAHLQIGQRKQRQFPSILGSSGNSSMRSVNSSASISGGLVQVDQGSVSAATMESILANAGEVAAAAGQGQTVSLVTADGHTIEILHGIDPSTMTSVPMTLVPSSEAEAMNNVANSIAASLGLSDHHHHQMTAAEFVDGSGGAGGGGDSGVPHAVYIMDSSQPAVEVDMSGMAGTLSADGAAMVFSTGGGGDVMGDPTGGQFIVQDIHGNQFRKITGIDENGKPVIFFQLSEENGPGGGLEDGSSEGGGSNLQDSNSVYVSSSHPVTVSSDHHHHHHQVLLTAAGEDGEHGTVYEMLAPSSGASQGVDHTHHHLQAQQVILSDGTTVLHHPGHHHQEYVHTTTSAVTPIVASSISASDTEGEREPVEVSGEETVQEVHIVLNPQDEQEEDNSSSSVNAVSNNSNVGQQVMESDQQQQEHEEVVVQDGEYHHQQEEMGEEEGEGEELVIQEQEEQDEEIVEETSPAERMEVVEESTSSSMILDEQGNSSEGGRHEEMIVVEEEMHLVDQDSGEPLHESDGTTSSMQEESSS